MWRITQSFVNNTSRGSCACEVDTKPLNSYRLSAISHSSCGRRNRRCVLLLAKLKSVKLVERRFYMMVSQCALPQLPPGAILFNGAPFHSSHVFRETLPRSFQWKRFKVHNMAPTITRSSCV